MCAVMRANAAAVLALAGCAYQPGSFHSVMQDFAGQQATVDCLDLSIQRKPNLPDGSAVVRFAFGNRCDHPTVVDLASAAIIGRTADGQSVKLTAYDPRHEIQVLRIDGRAVGGEAIASTRRSTRSASTPHRSLTDRARSGCVSPRERTPWRSLEQSYVTPARRRPRRRVRARRARRRR
jgi:hypothetical protein